MLHVSAEKSTGDGAAVMVDEFSRKMKGCDGEYGDAWAGDGPARVM
jgi:hypothetical protein